MISKLEEYFRKIFFILPGVRPICMTHVLFKLMEIRFNEMLKKKYLELPKLARFQVGFTNKMSTQINISRLMTQINKQIELTRNQRWNPKNKRNVTLGIFIDSRSVYNSINRPKLFQQLRQILPELKGELDFLEWVYGKQVGE